ncbi:MAG: TonB family protein [Acidobacteria bacterium]|nr:TonB family protein [Acidobacteriota bacterium]
MKRIGSVLFAVSFVLSTAALILAQSDVPREINGGVLNGKAIKLPKPVYSEEARAAGMEGTVRVNVLIDELGNVISAEIFGGRLGRVTQSADGKTENVEMEPVNPLLADAARQAALAAKFSPTSLNGVPVKVKGMIVYNFAAVKQPVATTGVKTISGGVLNGKAVSLPLPPYPPAARAVRASGAVTVQVVIGESGEVISAQPVAGHPLLRAAAVEAARGAKFSPTLLSGDPVKVSGVIIYNFAAPDGENK